MTKNLARKRIYGLTIRQWAALAAVILAILLFGCRFCYNTVRDRIAPVNQSSNKTIDVNDNSRQKPVPNKNLTIAEATERYLKFGNPTAASQVDPNNFLMVNPQFALSYNRQKAISNWVAWTVSIDDLGEAPRSNDFRPDTRLPNGWPKISTSDYTGSGYDRGHLCPSADRSLTSENNSATFLMTNIVPQTGDLNRGVWERFESYSRDLVKQGSELYIVAGNYGNAGKIKNKIVIPTNYWKIAVVLPPGLNDVSAINPQTRVIAIDMPNITGVKNDDWRKYRTTVRAIEQKANINLFTNLQSDLQNVLETRQDSQ
jgi:endonuclease G